MGGRSLPALLRPVVVVVAVVTAALVSAAGCASGNCPGFAMSLAFDHGGQPTPVAAAEWFAAHRSEVATVPRTGWQEDSRDDSGVVLRSGDATLHAIQGTDKTWQVDSGRQC
jgi:hypothetical protein